jgi:nucleotide-binding universal stress UspA family protein
MKILACIDGSLDADRALAWALNEASLRSAELTVLHAFRSREFTGPFARDASLDKERAEALADVEQALARLTGDTRPPDVEIETAAVMGRGAADAILRHRGEADLIVVGSRGLGPAGSAVLGSVSAHLVDHASCPVLVARSPEATRMVLATDGTPSSRDVPSILASWGTAFRGLPVEVVSVAGQSGFFAHDEVDALAEHAGIAEQVADELMELGWHAAATARVGDVSRQIIEEGRDWRADLIVTGSRGIGTLHRLIGGSVSHDVLLHARSSVLVVRGHVPALARQAAALSPA